MFICGITKRVSKPNEDRIPLVIETRDVIYIRTLKTGAIAVHRTMPEKIDPLTHEIAAYGSEIVKEIGVTAEGLKLFNEALDKLSLESEPVPES